MKPVVLELVVASSITLINVYDVVLVGVPLATLNAEPLVIFVTVVTVPPTG